MIHTEYIVFKEYGSFSRCILQYGPLTDKELKKAEIRFTFSVNVTQVDNEYIFLKKVTSRHTYNHYLLVFKQVDHKAL